MTRGGTLVASEELAVEGEHTASVPVPAIESGELCVTITQIGRPGKDHAASVLALPEEAADEMCEMFAKMVGEVRTRGLSRGSTLIYVHPDQVTDGFDTQRSRRPLLKEHHADQVLKEQVWMTHFRPLSSDFASALEGQAAASDCPAGRRAPLATYLIANRRWATASFLLTTCLRSGARVSLGPFALSEEDISVESLERDFGDVGPENLVVGKRVVGAKGSGGDLWTRKWARSKRAP
ncbi:unnamed protein product [Ostreobium quekettii]|uniref:Uncharacterized protein n=1 Tax=Ostreobium quekettii TaxID=121088 RepID=A0A8S1J8R5_9CHLO|nr:unnamed protein product [Ostreobium quekettii]